APGAAAILDRSTDLTAMVLFRPRTCMRSRYVKQSFTIVARMSSAVAASANPAQQILATPGTVTSSFGWRQLRITGGCLLFLFAEQLRLQPVQVDIDDRRRIESEDLRQGQTADDGVAERLANFRNHPCTHQHTHSGEHWRDSTHRDT